MRGINKVVISGNATGKIEFSKTGNGADACTFSLASDRHGSGGVVTAFVKVNVYLEHLVKTCRVKLQKGCYLLVEGELMNRVSPAGKMVEVRAWDVIFLHTPSATEEATDGAGNSARHR